MEDKYNLYVSSGKIGVLDKENNEKIEANDISELQITLLNDILKRLDRIEKSLGDDSNKK